MTFDVISTGSSNVIMIANSSFSLFNFPICQLCWEVNGLMFENV